MIHNPSDDDNDETDRPEFWEDEDEDCLDCGMCEDCIERSIGAREEMEPVNHFTDVRGPENCPRRCSECPDGKHHWLIMTFPGCLEPGDDDWEESLNHPAVQEWLTIRNSAGEVLVRGEYDPEDGGTEWLQCKHCTAWHPITEAMLDDPDFEFV